MAATNERPHGDPNAPRGGREADPHAPSAKGENPEFAGGDRESPEDSSPRPDAVDDRPAPTLADASRENPSTHPATREALDEASDEMTGDSPDQS